MFPHGPERDGDFQAVASGYLCVDVGDKVSVLCAQAPGAMSFRFLGVDRATAVGVKEVCQDRLRAGGRPEE